MSDSQPADVSEEELVNATVGDDPADPDTAEPATLPNSGLAESTHDVQSEVQQAAAEGEADENTAADAEDVEAERSEKLQQEDQVQGAAAVNPQDASSVQLDMPTAGSQQTDADVAAAEHMSASHGPTETEQDAEVSGSASGQASSAADDSSSVDMNDELFSTAAGRQPSAEQQLVPGFLASALANPELDPDHPLLARAQKALSKQLLAVKDRLEAEVREKANALQVLQTSSNFQPLLWKQSEVNSSDSSRSS
ncbi:hypothetical protein ABBQ38_004974 [Trebouxia sp. C0009 RCD-2024]